MNAPESHVPATLDEALPLVLVVDDEVRSQEAMRRTLEEDYRVLCAGDADAARALLERHAVAVILCDQRMPGTSGVDFLKEARERWPEVVRVVISGYADSEDIIAGINDAGIYQYVLKPWVPEHLLDTVRGAIEASSLHRGLQRLELDLRAGPAALRARKGQRLAQAQQLFDFDRIVRAPGSPLDALCALAARVARHDLSVLVLGESGTGKELMARAIHYASPRRDGPFVVENCAAIPDTLLESELFGHKRGSFTGAVDDHVGLIQRAHGGTIFLDEIGETSPLFQVKLLRVLQEGEVRPVGGARAVPVDVRVIAATHRDLEADMRAGRFREDLYYRIATFTLAMPPLRERPGDVVPIAERLLADVCRELGAGPARFDDDARALLMGYPWPGNIRELRNEIARAVALTDAPEAPKGSPRNGVHDGLVVTATSLSPRLLKGRTGTAHAASAAALPSTGTLQERLDAIEAMLLREVMLRQRWNKTRAAEELGLSRVGLRAKLLRFGIEAKGVPAGAGGEAKGEAHGNGQSGGHGENRGEAHSDGHGKDHREGPGKGHREGHGKGHDDTRSEVRR